MNLTSTSGQTFRSASAKVFRLRFLFLGLIKDCAASRRIMNRQDATARFAHIHALIAEDDALIALDMEQTLCAHFGFRASVVHGLGEGLKFLSGDRPHVAVLDLNLDGESIEPLARALFEAGVPILYVSGYRHHPLDELAWGLKLEKPYSAEQLIEMMERTLEQLEG